ncbi:MAG: Gfo/Idh/MocA family oxidoreductase [Phycisphaerae bacterium]|nr:Gfo/Idh/MocA family oxidoreductase [Phycisphaerae bacterium]
MKKVKVGIIGCGNSSPQYLKNTKPYSILEIAAVADAMPERAKARAQEFGVPRVLTVKEMLADPSIQVICNLTTPLSHAQINLAAIKAGKSVYVEKPLAVNRADGRKTVAAAKKRGVRVGCAPDTFLGGGIQTSRKLIDDGWIGQPVAATAFFTCRGHERWHPDPEFYYQVGGGPMLDMGPYYLTALVNLLGPVKRVSGSVRTTFPERTITSAGKFGQKIKVEVPTHVAGTLEFACGAIGTIVTSFDVWNANLPRIEIHGTEGSLSVPDPNGFGGEVKFCRAWAKEFATVPHTHSTEVGRGIGIADLAYGLVFGRPHRANGDLANHVLDVMFAFEESSRTGRHVAITTTCDRPAALPVGLIAGQLDE